MHDVLTSGRRRDEGFTLIELIVSIAILGVVMMSVTGLLFTALTTNNKTRDRLDSDRGEQFASIYFANDAQSAAAGGIVTSGTPQCGDGTGTLVAEFRGVTYDANTPTTSRIVVSTYVVQSATVNGVPVKQLHRLVCEAAPAATPPLTPLKDMVLARALATTPGASPSGSPPTLVTAVFTRIDGSQFTLVGRRRTS